MSGQKKYLSLNYSHPGILLKEDLDEVGLTAYRVSKETGISQVNLSKILQGKRAITPDTGLRLAKFLGMSENYFINMQVRYETQRAKMENKTIYDEIKTYPLFSHSH